MASPGSVVIQFLVDAKKAAGDAAKFATSLGKVDSEADSLDRTLDALDSELDSIGRASADLSRDMGKAGVGFDSVGDDAEDAARRVRIAAREMADGVHDGGTKIDAETSNIKTSMGEAGREAGGEMIGNIAESIGSGTGTITDTVQGTLGGLTNMAASIPGPWGLAFGAIAAGAGLMFASITKQAEATKKRIGAMTQALIDLGETASATAKEAMWQAWVDNLEEGSTTVADIADGLRDAGVKQGVFKDAVTGSVAAQKQVVGQVDSQIRKLEDLNKKQGGLGFMDAERLRKLKLIKSEIDGGNDSIDDANDALKDSGLLTGDAKRASEKWADEQEEVYNQTHKIKKELDAIPNNIPVNVIVTRKDKKGNPSKLGPGQFSVPEGPAPTGLTASTRTTVTMAMAPQASVIVTEEQIFRAVQRLMLRGNARNGRVVLVG